MNKLNPLIQSSHVEYKMCKIKSIAINQTVSQPDIHTFSIHHHSSILSLS